MKTVVFFRHGKSDWDADYEHDHNRPLAKRGRRAAKKMGRYLSNRGEVPTLVITSTATRALKTAAIAAKAGDWDAEIRESRELYEAVPSYVLELIQALPDQISSIMLVGHEPTWSASIALLTGSSEIDFPTAAMARIALDVPGWEEVQPGSGELQWLVVPRSLDGS